MNLEHVGNHFHDLKPSPYIRATSVGSSTSSSTEWFLVAIHRFTITPLYEVKRIKPFVIGGIFLVKDFDKQGLEAAEVITEWKKKITVRPRTLLGMKLVALRKKIVDSGTPLL